MASLSGLDVGDGTSCSAALRGGWVQAERLEWAVLACPHLARGPWGQHGFKQVRRLCGWNLAQTPGPVSSQHVAVPRDPDILAHGHRNVAVCLKTELLRGKKLSPTASPEKEVLYLAILPEGVLGFVLISLSARIKWRSESLDHHPGVCLVAPRRP